MALAVEVVRAGPVTTILLNRREKRNAVDRATAHALYDAFVAFDRDDTAAVAVLAGNHGIFCAGADLTAMDNPMNEDVGEIGPMGISRLRLSKPVIAAVSGFAVAGGLELACWCDMRVVEESAVFGVFCRRWGVPLIDGGTIRLPSLIGMSRAMDMILTGRPVKADEALLFGLANRVVPDGQARQAAEDLARQIAAFPQACLRSDRLSAYECLGRPERDALAREFQHGLRTLSAPDAMSGAARFAGGAGRSGKF